jgi:hypothetical protein
MRRLFLAAAALAVGLTLAGAGTSAPARHSAAGDFWVGQWTITLPGSEQGLLGVDRMSEAEAVAEWTTRAHQIGPNVKPRSEDCLAYLHATYSWNGGGTWVGCSKHVSGVAVVTEDNFLVGLTSDGTGIGQIFAGQNPADRGGISVDHSKSCTAGGNSTTYSCTTLFTGQRADRVPTGTTKTVTEPKAGGSLTVASPPIPADCPTSKAADTCPVDVTVSSSTGDLTGTEVIGEGGVEALVAVLFLHCWTILPVSEFMSLTEKLRTCVGYVKPFLHGGGNANPRTRVATGTASGCATKRLSLRLKVRKKKIVSTRVVKRKLTPKSILYKCTMDDGKLHITVDGRRKGGLRKALGKRLNLKIVRSKKAPRRNAKLNITFGW